MKKLFIALLCVFSYNLFSQDTVKVASQLTPDQQAEAAVRIPVPPLIGRRDALARLLERLHGHLPERLLGPEQDEPGRETPKRSSTESHARADPGELR